MQEHPTTTPCTSCPRLGSFQPACLPTARPGPMMGGTIPGLSLLGAELHTKQRRALAAPSVRNAYISAEWDELRIGSQETRPRIPSVRNALLPKGACDSNAKKAMWVSSPHDLSQRVELGGKLGSL
ncbi:hypothetical protein J3458_019733 [Metarhizium acridum]|uniref:uncharacterized protein n=1 Tax=Metarhizium acridum TaxID=92637 RepID=UPI001C6B0ADA|nr:hypothetical protein J3458_019733 [Metarhizium acridum]